MLTSENPRWLVTIRVAMVAVAVVALAMAKVEPPSFPDAAAVEEAVAGAGVAAAYGLILPGLRRGVHRLKSVMRR